MPDLVATGCRKIRLIGKNQYNSLTGRPVLVHSELWGASEPRDKHFSLAIQRVHASKAQTFPLVQVPDSAGECEIGNRDPGDSASC